MISLGEALFPLLTLASERAIREMMSPPAVMQHAMRVGAGKVAKWLLKKHGKAVQPLGRVFWHISCEYGHTELAKWVAKTWSVTRTSLKLDAILLSFLQTCKSGHTETAKWIIEAFNLSENEIREISNQPFVICCARGHLETAQWLAEFLHLTSEYVHSYCEDPFESCCQHGNVEVARWLEKTFNYSPSDLSDSCFALMCQEGQLEMLKWLATNHGLSSFTGTRSAQTIVLECARRNYSELVCWLIDSFHLVPMESFKVSCEYGRLDVARAISVHYKFTPDVVRADNNYALRASCNNGHHAVTLWLTETFHLSEEEVRACNHDALSMINRKTGPLNERQWMWQL